jgi:hypothetical protein
VHLPFGLYRCTHGFFVLLVKFLVVLKIWCLHFFVMVVLFSLIVALALIILPGLALAFCVAPPYWSMRILFTVVRAGTLRGWGVTALVGAVVGSDAFSRDRRVESSVTDM